jgi:hypothetical protein
VKLARGVQWVVGFFSSIKDGVSSVPEAVDALPGQLHTSALNAGSSLIDGLVGGINAGIGRVRSAVDNLSTSISDRFTGFWDINSPSGRMEEYTRNIAKGGVIGLDRSAPMLRSAMTDMIAPGQTATVSSPAASIDFSNLAGAMFASGAAAGDGGARGGVEVNVNINVQGGGGGADEEWERLRPRVRREVEMGLRNAGEL